MNKNKAYYECADIIRARTGMKRFRTAAILGSGLGSVLEGIDKKTVISYAELPDFPLPKVEGHAGNVICGEINGVSVVGFQGRAHLYEGHPPQSLLTPIRTLKMLGVEVLVQTNSAGGLRENLKPGTLAVITDHINFFGNIPLTGENDAAIGPRFFDMTHAYSPELIKIMKRCAAEYCIPLKEGVYAYFMGPNFETPAEIRAMKLLGADLVGMSTVPETLTAVHAGIQVAALSCVTNYGAGISKTPLSHEETLAESKIAGKKMSELIFVKHARGQLKGTPVKIATVINFPHGTGNPAEYMETAKQALESGADELDFVFPYRDWLNGNRTVAVSKLQSMSALRNGRTVLKIILETGELPDLKTVREISDVCLQTGIDFLKTSTGKTPVSASPEATSVFLEAIRDFGHPCGIKPSGGIRDYAVADRYLSMAETAWGKDMISAANFRFGASGLLDNLLGGLSSLHTENTVQQDMKNISVSPPFNNTPH
ncbi:hypothetical protein CHS0354_001988 [Potamilus streckersoni]|uniref:purine-nucleoside phosphorylase n=1 Tax=Potamilus streckersoni TaxID=2493646 RepID=A0AAE0T6H6_9BIVA|nr:hypothetical protein CHS0354_001988 [Potamilus streckersoni]